MCSFDDPASFTQAAAMRFATPSDRGCNPGSVQGLAVLVMVVAAIRLDNAGLAEGAATLAADRRDGLDQRQELSDVVTVGAGQNDRERNALRFGNEVVFGTGASTIGGVRSCF